MLLMECAGSMRGHCVGLQQSTAARNKDPCGSFALLSHLNGSSKSRGQHDTASHEVVPRAPKIYEN